MTGSAPSGNAETTHGPEITALEAMILGQPDAIRDMITSNLDQLRAAMAIVAGSRRIRITGTGASFFAAAAGEWMFREIGINALAARSFELARYTTGFEPGDVLIVISHNGTSSSSIAALQRASRSGLKTIGITGPGHHLQAADVVVETALEERSAVHTASSTTAMAAIAAIAARFEPQSELASALPSLPETMRSLLETRPTAREVAAAVASEQPRVMLTGGAGLYATALSGALLAKKAAHILVEGAHIEDALHGSLLGVHPNDLLVQLAPEGPSTERNADLARVADTIGLHRWKIGGKAGTARWHTPLPNVPEVITPLLTAIPLQWFALETALQLGTDPDAFRHDENRFAEAFSQISR